MNNITKVCITLAAGSGMCVSGPALATVAVVAIVTVGAVEMSKNRGRET